MSLFTCFLDIVPVVWRFFVIKIAFQFNANNFSSKNHSNYSIKQYYNKMTNTKEESFSKRMRKETRDVHKISDALINAKLAFGKQFLLIQWSKVLIAIPKLFQRYQTTMCGQMGC